MIETAINTISIYKIKSNNTSTFQQNHLILLKTIKKDVCVYINKLNGSKYVCKTSQNSTMRNEIDILNICRGCPFIIDDWYSYIVNNDQRIMIPFFEYGDLYEVCSTKKQILSSQIRRISQQVLQALQYMHQRSIIHRDIKPANIVLTNNSCYFDVKVIDFGLAVMYDENSPPTDRVGTPNYAAPEICKRLPQSPKCDIWSFGMTIYAITTLTVPILRRCDFDISSISYENHRHFTNNPILVDFLRSIFKLNSAERPSAKDLLKHSWVK